MKVQGVKGTPIASIDLTGANGKINADLVAGGLKIPAEVTMEKQGDGLVAHLKMPKTGMAADIVISSDDVKEIMGGMGGDVVKFALGALMKGKRK